MNYWSTRNQTYKNNARGRILIAVVISVLSVIFGYIHFVTGLVLAYFIGNLAGLLALSSSAIGEGRLFFSGVSKQSIKAMFRKHIDFAKINVPHAVVDNVQEQGVVFFLAYFFTEALVGLYGYAFRLLRLPLSLIGEAFYQVFYQNITQGDYTAEALKRMVKKAYGKAFLIGVVPFTILIFFGPELFSIVFGENWRGAGVIVQILTPWLFLHFIVSPVSSIPLVVKKQKAAFILECISVVIKYSLLITAGVFYNSTVAFVLLSIFGSVFMIFIMFWYIYIIRDESLQEE